MAIGGFKRVHERLAFAKALSRSEPCERTTSYRRKVKRDSSSVRRIEDKKTIKEQT